MGGCRIQNSDSAEAISSKFSWWAHRATSIIAGRNECMKKYGFYLCVAAIPKVRSIRGRFWSVRRRIVVSRNDARQSLFVPCNSNGLRSTTRLSSPGWQEAVGGPSKLEAQPQDEQEERTSIDSPIVGLLPARSIFV